MTDKVYHLNENQYCTKLVTTFICKGCAFEKDPASCYEMQPFCDPKGAKGPFIIFVEKKP